MAERMLFQVLPDVRQGQGWVVQRDGDRVDDFTTKEEAVAEARRRAREAQPSQLLIHTEEGSIAEELNYTDDPSPPRG